ncbi:MAG: acyl-CoA synthetase (AMP-forming)/AMP-acid ligase II, partial [Glaciecola sp.]
QRTGDDGGPGLALWLAANPAATLAPRNLDPRTTALLLATSGTTGLPKAAALTSRGLTASMGRLLLVPLGYQSGPRKGRDLLLAALPLTHVMGFIGVLGAMAAGIPFVHQARFDAAQMLDLIEQRRPNTFVGVPTMYADLERAGAAERDLSSIQLFISGADVMPPDRARRFQEMGALGHLAGRGIGSATFVDGYGMVELSGAAALRIYPPAATARIKIPSFAVALPGFRVRAVGADGEPVGRGEVGELQFAGPGVTSGYEGRPGTGPDADGWFSTGDQGRVWAGGVFAFSGRSKDRLKVGGFSVFPAEVEHELRKHPQVQDVAIVGLPDERLGERPVALVVSVDDAFDQDEFLAWAAEHVAGYRRPRACATVDDLPRGNHGKLDRSAATAAAAALLP